MLLELEVSSWQGEISNAIQQQAITALENGKVVYLPRLPFILQPHETSLLSPDVCSGSRKNVCYDLNSDKLSGYNQKIQSQVLKDLMQRYAQNSRQLLQNLFPQYSKAVQHARTSYRPVEVAGRIPPSYRKDDTRLHVDAFPSTPTQGKRILRIFSNINPHGESRVWRIGDDFTKVIAHFAPKIRPPVPGSAAVQKLFKITRGYRTAYDHYMLNIHNKMKFDQHYQQHVTQMEVRFPPGTTWCVYTDQVSHAAMAGQYVLEQTFYLPVNGLQYPETAPLRVMEQYLQQQLI